METFSAQGCGYTVATATALRGPPVYGGGASWAPGASTLSSRGLWLSFHTVLVHHSACLLSGPLRDTSSSARRCRRPARVPVFSWLRTVSTPPGDRDAYLKVAPSPRPRGFEGGVHAAFLEPTADGGRYRRRSLTETRGDRTERGGDMAWAYGRPSRRWNGHCDKTTRGARSSGVIASPRVRPGSEGTRAREGVTSSTREVCLNPPSVADTALTTRLTVTCAWVASVCPAT